jgi:hypothetical protein
MTNRKESPQAAFQKKTRFHLPFTRIIQIALNEAYRIALKVAKYLFKRHFWKNNFILVYVITVCAQHSTNGKSMMAIKNILFGAKLTVNICV